MSRVIARFHCFIPFLKRALLLLVGCCNADSSLILETESPPRLAWQSPEIADAGWRPGGRRVLRSLRLAGQCGRTVFSLSFRWDVSGGERRLCPQRKSDVAIMGYVLASWT